MVTFGVEDCAVIDSSKLTSRMCELVLVFLISRHKKVSEKNLYISLYYLPIHVPSVEQISKT